ncbi:hypothetical protein Ancab_029807 [Ancistrocladus abbreviatus]
MASSQSNEEEARRLAEQLGKTLKEGERILGPTRRPDGTLRKPIRIRAGYVPQEEVAIYQSRGALWRKEIEAQVGPPGYDPAMEAKPKSKSVKRNERKKEKRLRAALEKAENSEQIASEEITKEEPNAENLSRKLESLESVASQMCQLSLSAETSTNTFGLDSVEVSNPDNSSLDIDKQIRALKKKDIHTRKKIGGGNESSAFIILMSQYCRLKLPFLRNLLCGGIIALVTLLCPFCVYKV